MPTVRAGCTDTGGRADTLKPVRELYRHGRRGHAHGRVDQRGGRVDKKGAKAPRASGCCRCLRAGPRPPHRTARVSWDPNIAGNNCEIRDPRALTEDRP